MTYRYEHDTRYLRGLRYDTLKRKQDELYGKLAELAERTEKTVSDLIRQALTYLLTHDAEFRIGEIREHNVCVPDALHIGLMALCRLNKRRMTTLTRVAVEHMLEHEEIVWQEFQFEAPPPAAAVKENDKPVSVQNSSADEKLFEKLCVLRKTLAVGTGKPSFLIFNNETLCEMVRTYPITRSEFMAVKGVGPSKVKKFGTVFMQEILRHLQENPHIQRPPPQQPQQLSIEAFILKIAEVPITISAILEAGTSMGFERWNRDTLVRNILPGLLSEGRMYVASPHQGQRAATYRAVTRIVQSAPPVPVPQSVSRFPPLDGTTEEAF